MACFTVHRLVGSGSSKRLSTSRAPPSATSSSINLLMREPPAGINRPATITSGIVSSSAASSVSFHCTIRRYASAFTKSSSRFTGSSGDAESKLNSTVPKAHASIFSDAGSKSYKASGSIIDWYVNRVISSWPSSLVVVANVLTTTATRSAPISTHRGFTFAHRLAAAEPSSRSFEQQQKTIKNGEKRRK